MVRAAAAADVAMCLSTFSTASAADVAAAAPNAVRLLQVYVFRDHAVTDELIAEAIDLGFSAVFLTVDLPVLGPRDRERRIHWAFTDDSLPAIAYAISRGLGNGGSLEPLLDPALDWAYLERLASSLPVPVIVRGVLDPEDALLAAEHGAAGVVVSNHGGRQLDGVHATLDALPAIVDAVGDRLEVLLDGGIRRGTDVAIAMALGARAVLAGRMPMFGLAAAGEDGARTVLQPLGRSSQSHWTSRGVSRVGRRPPTRSAGVDRRGRARVGSSSCPCTARRIGLRERHSDPHTQPRRPLCRTAGSRRSSSSVGRCASSSASTSRRPTSTSGVQSHCSGCARFRMRGTSVS